MTIENSDKVDGLGIDNIADEAVLLISDHLRWDDERHFRLIEKKVNKYLEFIQSGQIYEALPNAAGKKIKIKLIYEHIPDISSKGVLDNLVSQFRGSGVIFTYESLPDKYQNCG